ncbi:alginate lyase family protein [Oceanobacter mangrovi]|uniref:alginate lyase family protein n=1 Tax=Oceanobacter mangrovi TaxID=2862510 RepID=UPI001C8D227E|nr:alginate lyase family protein [Oceanobacter mangrovi]
MSFVIGTLAVLCTSCLDSTQQAVAANLNDTNSAPGPAKLPENYLWIDAERLSSLPMSGAGWENLYKTAQQPAGYPNLSDQDDPTNVIVMAKALVYARTGDEKLRQEVIASCLRAIGTDKKGRVLEVSKELMAYILAADLVKLPDDANSRFKQFLITTLIREFPSGKTIRSTHEVRPNNWGTYAGATRIAIAGYLGDSKEVARAAKVFKGWLGDESIYAGFRFKDDSWQADANHPTGINPPGATKYGHSIDGVLPDDQRRGGSFSWPPPKENYVYTALQGAMAQAVLLDRMGYPVWQWQDKALLRAFNWLYTVADYPAVGDDTWLPFLVNFYYDSDFPVAETSKPGKNAGWTDWTHNRIAP